MLLRGSIQGPPCHTLLRFCSRLPPCSAFRNAQPNACSTYRGSCLDRQISHLYFEDLARMVGWGGAWKVVCWE